MSEPRIDYFLEMMSQGEEVQEKLELEIINPEQAKAILTGAIQAIVHQFGFPLYDFKPTEENFTGFGAEYTNQFTITDPKSFIQDLTEQLIDLMPGQATDNQQDQLPKWSIEFLPGFDRSEYIRAANQEWLAVKTELNTDLPIDKEPKNFLKKYSKNPIRSSQQGKSESPSYKLGIKHQHADIKEFIEKQVKENPNITRGELANLLQGKGAVSCDSWAQ